MQTNSPVNYIHFQSIDSTNTWAKNNATILDPSQITCITACEQTQGRGRFQRKWISPKNVNLYATYYFCIPLKSSFLPNIGQVLSISCAKLLEYLGFSPELKWPNDILIEKKKIAGILCETMQTDNLLSIILGIGLNINMENETMHEIDQPVNSLKAISQKHWSIEEILHKLTNYFLTDLHVLKSQGFQSFQTYYEAHLAFKNTYVTFQDGNRLLSGICTGLSKNGNLILLSSSGEKIEVSAGSMLSSL